MTRFYIILFLSIVSSGIYAQTSEIDSLRLLVRSCKSDTHCVKSHLALSNRLWRTSNFDSALTYANKAVLLAEQIDYEKGSSNALNTIGVIHLMQGDNQGALDYFFKSLKVKEAYGDELGSSKSYNNIGLVYGNMGNYKEALNCHFKSLKLKEKIKDELSIPSSLVNIGLIYETQNQYEEALEYYNRAVTLLMKMDKKFELAQTYNNIGVVYTNQLMLDEALDYSLRALEIRKEIEDNRGLAATYSNIGNIYQNMAVKITDKDSTKYRDKLYQDALDHFFMSIKIKKEINDHSEISGAYVNIGLTYLLTGQNQLARKYFQEALQISLEVGEANLVKHAYDGLYKVDSATANYKGAFHNYKKYIVYRDSLQNEENRKKIFQQQLLYEYEKKVIADSVAYENQKALDDVRNKKRIAVEKEKQQKQFIVILFSLTGSVLVIILLLIIYRRLQITKRQKITIEEQKEEVEAQRDEIERQKHIVEEQRDDIVSSITYAKRIQTAILPPESSLNHHLPNYFILYRPKDVVAGDFYWLEAKGDNIFIAVADCTGHGVPGAMVSVVCHGALNRCIREYNLTKPSEILDKTRELVLETFRKSEEQVKDGMDISLLKLNLSKQKAEWAGANNPLYYLQKGQDELDIIKADKQPIGFVFDPKPFTNIELDLKEVEQIYLFTDGYADQFGGEKGKKMGYKKFRQLLFELSGKEMGVQKEVLSDNFENWMKHASEEQVDDVCVMGVRF